MAHIRETIETLSKILKNFTGTNVSAEVFRQAKFNQQSVTEPMWQTLCSFLGFHKTRKLKSSQRLGAVERSQLVSVCQHEMFIRGYGAREFFGLPCDMSRGSREVLLAIGWLIAKENVLEKFTCYIEPINTEDPPFDPSLCGNFPSTRAGLELPIKSRETLTQRVSQYTQHLVWMNGKLNASLRMLLSSRNEYAKLSSKIHAATCWTSSKSQGGSQKSVSKHLSALDVYLLRNPKQMAKYQAALEYQNSCIHSLIMWTQNEPVFWKWMESVLEAKLKDCSEDSAAESHEEFPVQLAEYKPSTDLQKAKSHQVELSRVFQSQEHLYKRISKTWKRMRTELGGAEALEQEWGEILRILDQELVEEIEKLQPNMAMATTHGDKVSCGPLAISKHLKYIDATVTKHHNREVASRGSDAAAEISTLSQEVHSLEKELRALQQKNREKMLKFSDKFEDIICIPPSVR